MTAHLENLIYSVHATRKSPQKKLDDFHPYRGRRGGTPRIGRGHLTGGHDGG